MEAKTKKEAADAALKDAQAKKTDAETERSKAQKKYDEAIAQNGELTQADVDQANTDAEEAKKAEAESVLKKLLAGGMTETAYLSTRIAAKLF